MRRYLLQWKAEGKTILLAPHNKEDIQLLCDTVYEMNKGEFISLISILLIYTFYMYNYILYHNKPIILL